MDVPQFIYLPDIEYLGCFQIVEIMNKSFINFHEQVFGEHKISWSRQVWFNIYCITPTSYLFNICRVYSDSPLFIPNSGDMYLLSFSLHQTDQRFINFIDFFFFQEPAFIFFYSLPALSFINFFSELLFPSFFFWGGFTSSSVVF